MIPDASQEHSQADLPDPKVTPFQEDDPLGHVQLTQENSFGTSKGHNQQSHVDISPFKFTARNNDQIMSDASHEQSQADTEISPLQGVGLSGTV